MGHRGHRCRSSHATARPFTPGRPVSGTHRTPPPHPMGTPVNGRIKFGSKPRSLIQSEARACSMRLQHLLRVCVQGGAFCWPCRMNACRQRDARLFGLENSRVGWLARPCVCEAPNASVWPAAGGRAARRTGPACLSGSRSQGLFFHTTTV